MSGKVAILLDGGFVRPMLGKRLKRFATADDIESLAAKLRTWGEVNALGLYRIFYYDCDPYGDSVVNPISRAKIDLGTTATAQRMRVLLSSVETKPNFALRKGHLLAHGWRLKKAAVKSLYQGPRTIEAADIEPFLQQKGVDQRIGLDIAGMAAKRIVDTVVMVVGDSDFVPVLKSARRESLRVLLFIFNHPVKRDLRAHADIVIPDAEIPF